MSKKKYHVRKFLNKTSGMAALEINASYEAWNFNCDVTISDCNRRIDLDFNMWEPKNVKEKLAKLDLLISELQALRDYLGPATTDFIALNEAHRNNSKKTKNILSVLDEVEDDQ